MWRQPGEGRNALMAGQPGLSVVTTRRHLPPIRAQNSQPASSSMGVRVAFVLLACLAVSARAQESVLSSNSDAADIHFDSDGGELVIPQCMEDCDPANLDLLMAASDHHELCNALGVVYDSMCMDDCKGSPAYGAIDGKLEECCTSRPEMWRR